MALVRIAQVDVFTPRAFAGNPAGVVLDADALSERQMGAIAREMNLSETAFVFSPNALGEVPVRFFTPRCEVPACGHATLAAHFVRSRALGQAQGDAVQRSPGARWEVRWESRDEGAFLVMTQGPVVFDQVLSDADVRATTSALGTSADRLMTNWPVQVVSTGHSKVLVPIQSPATLGDLTPDLRALASVSATVGVAGFFAFTVAGDGVAARMFAPSIGIPEDPVNGSGHGPLGAYLLARGGRAASMVAEGGWSSMGTHLGRPGRVWLRARPGETFVEVGGFVTPVFEANLAVPDDDTP